MWECTVYMSRLALFDVALSTFTGASRFKIHFKPRRNKRSFAAVT